MDKLKAIIVNKQKEVMITPRVKCVVCKACKAVLKLEGISGRSEVNINFVNNDEIKRLNLKFREIDKSTDVLSFPLCDDGKFDINMSTGAKLLGDIVISVETAKAQAEEYGHSLLREIAFLTVHSMLHLLGYDHMDEVTRREMREKEETALTLIGQKRD
ncbi:MAG: rRNA maturation RNase YbeY [bacterium]|nr:rRNA maturation RNase YbeY [bacterium]